MQEVPLIKKIFGFIAKKDSIKNISARKATKIQHMFINDSMDCNQTIYDEIALQLQTPHDDIFNAVLYYLEKIALNHPQAVSQIVPILNKNLAQNKNNPLRRDKISQVLSKINSPS